MLLHKIRYLKRAELDITKWDNCIEESPNGLIYAFSFYLDAMAKHWDALVIGDYEFIMPLTWNKKWGFRYLYQPPFTQQLGIFSVKEITPPIIGLFAQELKHRFSFGEIFLNYNNDLTDFTKRSNFVLLLNCSYDILSSNYKSDAVKNLKRSLKFGLAYCQDAALSTALKSYRTEYHDKIPHLSNSDYLRFQKLCDLEQQKSELIARAVKGSDDNILAIAILFKKNKRLYLIQSTTFPEGRKTEANYYLIDQIIREFANTDFLLDFEGSDIPGIAHFYNNFGSINQPYFFFRFNHLPVVLRWWKNRK